MSKPDKPSIDQSGLVKEWNKVLPNTMKKEDQSRVYADESDPMALRVQIITAGHTGYTFDFKVTYIDSREIKTDLVDVQQGNIHIDEHTEIIQNLIEDYVRQMHECAQALQKVTNK